MFKQEQPPRGNPPKKCSANAKQKPKENTLAEEYSPQSWICNFTKSHLRIGAPSQVYCTLTEHSHRKVPPKGWFCIDKQLVKILKKDFVERNLRNSWENHCFNWLLSLKTFICTIWQNFLIKENKLTCNK